MEEKVRNNFGIGISIGIALGLVFGTMTDNVGLGIALGAALGLLFGYSLPQEAEGHDQPEK
ncbi:MAG TPA: hypothetical protein VE134_03030 [Methanomicrobiales archaeon]|nr:hypothetical protein [Methanomicrobiales archaeon]